MEANINIEYLIQGQARLREYDSRYRNEIFNRIQSFSKTCCMELGCHLI